MSDRPRIPAERAARYRAAGWWRPGTLDAPVLHHGRTVPARPALVDGERRLTYGGLRAAIGRTAAMLQAKGVRDGDRVVVQLPNSIEYVVLMLAVMHIGAAPVLTLPSLRTYELDRIMTATRAVAVAVPRRMRRSDHLAMVDELRTRHPWLRVTLVAEGEDEAPAGTTGLSALCAPDATGPAPRPAAVSAAPDDIALLVLSSGTTGPPKLLARTHEEYGLVVRATGEVAAVDQDTVFLAVLPATHTFPLAYPGVLGTLTAGGTVVLGSADDPRQSLRLIEQERVTHVAATPGLVVQWLRALDLEQHDTRSLSVLQVGGAGLDAALAREARDRLGCALQQVYGMSEGLTTYTRLDDPDDVVLHTQGRPAFAGDELVIVDEKEEPVPPGTTGQLLTRGPFTIAGYYRDEDATRRSFTPDGFYRTGDMARLRPDGNAVVVGRLKNVINRGGEKVCAEELEQLVRELPSVAEVAAVPRPHPAYGETICLYVVAANGSAPALREIRQHLDDRGIARYKLPEHLELLDRMPTIGIGKVDRAALRERAAAEAAGQAR